MLNAELRTLHTPDGSPVCNVSFDLSATQLAVSARCVDAVKIARYRGDDLSTDDVLALHELTGVSAELHRLADHDAHGTVVLPLARFATLHDALADWTTALDARGWGREEELADRPIVDALIGPMASVRADAMQAVLAERATQQR